MMGATVPENEYMIAGKAAHKIFTDHVTGVKLDSRIPFTVKFQKPEHKVFGDYTSGYGLYGFIDAISYKTKTICEYKTSSKPWNQARFEKLMQIPFYGLATGFRKIYMVTSTPDLENFKTFYKELTDADIQNVKDWIDGAIAKLKAGDFYGDLDENRKCTGRCPYGAHCLFL